MTEKKNPTSVSAAASVSVSEAIRRRTSVRAFSARAVPEDLVRTVLELAGRSPSGGNIQPWQVHVVVGARLEKLKAEATSDIATSLELAETGRFYPPGLWEPHRSWRREAAVARSEALAFQGTPAEQTREVFTRNFNFFGAPVGLFFCIDRRMQRSQWLDAGIFMQSVMLLAIDHGLDTCPQAIWMNREELVRRHLDLDPAIEIVSGMAMGYRQADDPLCEVVTNRAVLEDFVQFHGAVPAGADVTVLE